MPDKGFLETYPLYRRFRLAVPTTVDEIDKPAINMDCMLCKSRQTFRMANQYYENLEYSNYPSGGVVIRAAYVCTSCTKWLRSFFIFVGPNHDFVTKVGQHPAWSIEPDARVESLLGAHSSLFRHGLVCESQSYGIAAFAYYRRIVEEVIDGLLDQIGHLMPDSEKEKYKQALAATKKTTVTHEKIALVRDLLPPILRPGNVNPLAVLHSTLSGGIHGQTDEDCLENAVVIRETLIFLVNQLATTEEGAKRFTDGMRRLLDKKK